jgi:hypothetical protein
MRFISSKSFVIAGEPPISSPSLSAGASSSRAGIDTRARMLCSFGTLNGFVR